MNNNTAAALQIMAPRKKLSREEKLQRKREAERLRYQRIKSDPEMYELEKQKNKERYSKRKEKRISVCEVGEIFREAGTAFNKLSEMTMLLHPMGDSPQGGKWTEDEVEMLRSCVHRFAVDLNKISLHMKNRTTSQIRNTLKKKAFEEAGIPVRQVSSTPSGLMQLPKPQVVATQRAISPQSVLGKNAEVTLNMLNATENEVDVEGLTNDVKLEFETSTDEVPT